jgi:hypothetical protein
MAVLLIIQEDIIYDDESVFEEEAKIKKRHNLKLLVTVSHNLLHQVQWKTC